MWLARGNQSPYLGAEAHRSTPAAWQFITARRSEEQKNASLAPTAATRNVVALTHCVNARERVHECSEAVTARAAMKLAFILASSAALQPPHVVVVGGGVGGLATAGRLAKRGARVTVLEKNDKVGGRVGEYTWQQHRWETGASLLLLLPDVYRDALEAAGADAARHQASRTCLRRLVRAARGPRTRNTRRRPEDAATAPRARSPGWIRAFREYRATAREYPGPAGPSSSRRIRCITPSDWYRGSSPRLSALWKVASVWPRRAVAAIVSRTRRGCGRSVRLRTSTWA